MGKLALFVLIIFGTWFFYFICNYLCLRTNYYVPLLSNINMISPYGLVISALHDLVIIFFLFLFFLFFFLKIFHFCVLKWVVSIVSDALIQTWLMFQLKWRLLIVTIIMYGFDQFHLHLFPNLFYIFRSKWNYFGRVWMGSWKPSRKMYS